MGFISLFQLADILINIIGVKRGDVLMIHTSLYKVKAVDFSSEDLIYLLKFLVGNEGTIIMPTFTKKHYNFLYSSKPFNCNKTMGGNGYINEIFRMMPDSIRSCHPLKSVAAWGKHAVYLTKDHHLSEFAFDENSPFYKFYTLEGKVVGIGVSSKYLSFYHTIEDTNNSLFPERRYSEPVSKECIDCNGNIMVRNFRHDIEEYVKKRSIKSILHYYSKDEIHDFKYKQIPFFVANSRKVYNKTLELRKKNITYYHFNLNDD